MSNIKKSHREKAKEFYGVLRAECENLGVSVREIKSSSMLGHLPSCRAIISYNIRKNLGLSYTIIGALLRKDHSTIIHYVREIDRFRKINEKYKRRRQGFVDDLKPTKKKESPFAGNVFDY
jgi:chromosomal replication initiation ATPase DnaA